jgi:hypothetical protein
MQWRESCEAKLEKEATQFVDFTDESFNKSDSNDSNIDGGDDDDDDGDDDDDDFCAACEGYFYAKHGSKCDWIQCVSCILTE